MTSRSHRSHTTNSSYSKQNRSMSTDHQYLKSSSEIDGRYQRPKLGLQHYSMYEPSSQILRQSGIYHHPALTPGQKLYLLDKCHIYDMDSSKKYRTNSYLKILSDRFEKDSIYKPEYRLNDPRDYSSYAEFVQTPRPTARPINAGYFTPKQSPRPRTQNNRSKKQVNTRSNNYLDINHFTFVSNPNTNLSKDKAPNSAQPFNVLSASSSTGNTNTPRQEPKQIPRIFVRAS